MSGEDNRTRERWVEKATEHSRGEREKKRLEKSGEKKERFRLKRLQNAPYMFCVFFFFNVMTSKCPHFISYIYSPFT